jgi:hypothetical protein
MRCEQALLIRDDRQGRHAATLGEFGSKLGERRLFAAAEVRVVGHEALTVFSAISGIARSINQRLSPYA